VDGNSREDLEIRRQIRKETGDEVLKEELRELEMEKKLIEKKLDNVGEEE